MEELTIEDNTSLRLTLEEMRLAMDQRMRSGDAIDQKANLLLGAAGLVLVLATSLSPFRATRPTWYWIGMAVAFALYMIVVVATLATSWPRIYRLPVAADWKDLDESLFNKSERDALLVLISSYVEQIPYNGRINQSKARRLRIGLVLLPAIVAIVMAVNLLPF